MSYKKTKPPSPTHPRARRCAYATHTPNLHSSPCFKNTATSTPPNLLICTLTEPTPSYLPTANDNQDGGPTLMSNQGVEYQKTTYYVSANVRNNNHSKSGPNWKFEVEEVSMKANGNSASNGCDEGDKFNAPRTKPILFSSLLNPECSSKKMNFRTLLSAVRMEHYDVVLPKASIDNIKSRFQKLMWNNDGVFLLTFASKSGMEQVLERGPWMIHNSPIILSIWSPNLLLEKGEDGLSLIATQIGKPIILDLFTSSMCVEFWGRISFARALIEISLDVELKHEGVMEIPVEDGTGYTKEIIRVEYEWKPPHCIDCKLFGHAHNLCPKRVKKVDTSAPNTDSPKDGFTKVTNRNNKVKKTDYNQPKTRPIGVYAKDSSSHAKVNSPFMTNSFDALNNLGEEVDCEVLKTSCTHEMGQSKGNGKRYSNKSVPSSSKYKPPIEKEVNVVLACKNRSSMGDKGGEADVSDEDEVFLPNAGMTSYLSLTGGGQQLEKDDLDFF
ncbi:hypothetical protein Tco_1023785 [Tanacetum coccineum]